MGEADAEDRGSVAGSGLEATAALERDARTLLDPGFLSGLHAEMETELGPEEAARALLQIGFLHGLKEALRTVKGAFGADDGGPAGASVAPPLAMRLEPRRAPPGCAALEVAGSWPECAEASARLACLGPCEGTGCFVSSGYTSGWLSGLHDADLLALETCCAASGREACRFVAREAEVWRASGDPRACALLDGLPFDALRAAARAATDADSPSGTLDRHAAAVHIWGPVMVIPFHDSDEALRAVELIGHDPAARDVSVVVVDLSGAVIDEAWGALALERIVDLIEAWGAEAIFAAPSPLSEPALATLERQPLFVHKDLAAGVACAFRVADAQRSAS